MAKTFWLILTVAALLWYTIITAYVAFKGAGDIRGMLERLEDNRNSDESK